MATIPIYNPQSPFLGLIPGGFRVGSTLKVRAQIQGFSNRCTINVQSGAALKPRDDTMLQVDIRPQENAIVRNHLLNQVPGAEERYGGNPIQAHQSFEIAITAEHSQYRITINGQHFCTFTHRLPLSQARYVSISGTCAITHIVIENVGSFAPTQPIYPPIATPAHPRFPIHHHPPAPPPMPLPIAPPPYPGLYPGHQHPAPYTAPKKEEKVDKASVKIAAGVGAAVGLTAIALSKARRNRRQ